MRLILPLLLLSSVAFAKGGTPSPILIVEGPNNFGPVVAGVRQVKSFTVKNLGRAEAVNLLPRVDDLSGNLSTAFSIDSNACGAALPVGAQCSVQVAFSSVDLGSVGGSLKVTYCGGGFSCGDSNPYSSIEISGTAVAGASGTPDLSLGGTGMISTSMSSIWGYGGGYVGLKSNGNIVVVGSGVIGEFKRNGSLNTAFGVNGFVGRNGENPNPIWGDGIHLKVGPDQQIFAVGVGGISTPIAVSKHSFQGVTDTAYRPNNSFPGIGHFVLPLPDGKAILVGRIYPNGNPYDYNYDPYGIVRLNADGSLDTSFGDEGGVRVSQIGRGREAVLLEDGSVIVAAGLGLAKINPSGFLDTSFGTGGVARGLIELQSVAKTSDGGFVVVAGTEYRYVTPLPVVAIRVAKYDATGTLVTSFGSGGTVAFSLGQATSSSGRVRELPSGELVVISYFHCLGGGPSACNIASASGSTLRKLTSGGTLVTSFGTNGSVAIPFPQQANSGVWTPVLELDQEGRIYTTTSNFTTAGGNMALRRFWP